jgi:branched-chain amino acid transport system permease protein
MNTTISAKGSGEAYEAPRITVLGTVTELTEWCVFGKSLVEPEVIRMLLFGLAMVLIMRFRPAGLLPSAVRKRELAERKP